MKIIVIAPVLNDIRASSRTKQIYSNDSVDLLQVLLLINEQAGRKRKAKGNGKKKNGRITGKRVRLAEPRFRSA